MAKHREVLAGITPPDASARMRLLPRVSGRLGTYSVTELPEGVFVIRHFRMMRLEVGSARGMIRFHATVRAAPGGTLLELDDRHHAIVVAMVVFLLGPGLVWIIFLVKLFHSTGPHVMDVVVALAIITAMIMIPATIYLLLRAPKALRQEAAMLRAALGERSN